MANQPPRARHQPIMSHVPVDQKSAYSCIVLLVKEVIMDQAYYEYENLFLG